jgi:hypothetical protein
MWFNSRDVLRTPAEETNEPGHAVPPLSTALPQVAPRMAVTRLVAYPWPWRAFDGSASGRSSDGCDTVGCLSLALADRIEPWPVGGVSPALRRWHCCRWRSLSDLRAAGLASLHGFDRAIGHTRVRGHRIGGLAESRAIEICAGRRAAKPGIAAGLRPATGLRACPGRHRSSDCSQAPGRRHRPTCGRRRR